MCDKRSREIPHRTYLYQTFPWQWWMTPTFCCRWTKKTRPLAYWRLHTPAPNCPPQSNSRSTLKTITPSLLKTAMLLTRTKTPALLTWLSSRILTHYRGQWVSLTLTAMWPTQPLLRWKVKMKFSDVCYRVFQAFIILLHCVILILHYDNTLDVSPHISQFKKITCMYVVLRHATLLKFALTLHFSVSGEFQATDGECPGGEMGQGQPGHLPRQCRLIVPLGPMWHRHKPLSHLLHWLNALGTHCQGAGTEARRAEDCWDYTHAGRWVCVCYFIYWV